MLSLICRPMSWAWAAGGPSLGSSPSLVPGPHMGLVPPQRASPAGRARHWAAVGWGEEAVRTDRGFILLPWGCSSSMTPASSLASLRPGEGHSPAETVTSPRSCTGPAPVVDSSSRRPLVKPCLMPSPCRYTNSTNS